MNQHRRRSIAWLIAGAGIAVVAVSAVLAFPIARKQWFLWKLRSGDSGERWAAAAELEATRRDLVEAWYVHRLLASPRPAERQRAAGRLATLRSPIAASQLVQELRRELVDRGVTLASGSSGAASVRVPWPIQFEELSAFQSLVTIGQPAILDLTDAVLGDDTLAAWGAACVLARIVETDPGAEQILAGMIREAGLRLTSGGEELSAELLDLHVRRKMFGEIHPEGLPPANPDGTLHRPDGQRDDSSELPR